MTNRLTNIWEDLNELSLLGEEFVSCSCCGVEMESLGEGEYECPSCSRHTVLVETELDKNSLDSLVPESEEVLDEGKGQAVTLDEATDDHLATLKALGFDVESPTFNPAEAMSDAKNLLGKAKIKNILNKAVARTESLWASKNKSLNEHQAFDVFLGKKNIDTVFYSHDANVDVDEVKKSLIDHDGYHPAIKVVKVQKRYAKKPLPKQLSQESLNEGKRVNTRCPSCDTVIPKESGWKLPRNKEACSAMCFQAMGGKLPKMVGTKYPKEN